MEKTGWTITKLPGQTIVFNIPANRYTFSVAIKKNTFTNLLDGCIVMKPGMHKDVILENNVGINCFVKVVISDDVSYISLNHNRKVSGVFYESYSDGNYTWTEVPKVRSGNLVTWEDMQEITKNAYFDHQYVERETLNRYSREISTTELLHSASFDMARTGVVIYNVWILPANMAGSYAAIVIANFRNQKIEVVKEMNGSQSDIHLTSVVYSIDNSDGNKLVINATASSVTSGMFTFMVKEVSFINYG